MKPSFWGVHLSEGLLTCIFSSSTATSKKGKSEKLLSNIEDHLDPQALSWCTSS